MTLLALISDIHANLPALEAVVAEIRAARPDAIYVLGDMINGCPWPAETLDLLTAAGWPMLLGNHDDAVLQLGTARMEARYADRERYAPLWWTREHIEDRHVALLTGLPLELALSFEDAPPVRLLHGLPGNFFIGFRPDSPEAWAAKQLSGVSEGVVAGGHTHVAMIRQIAGQPGWLVINSGSVGIPYDGDPRAGYVWLEGGRAGWRAEIRRVDYDRQAVAHAHRESGLLEAGGPMGEMVLRSVLTGLPWVSDFGWWLREQPEQMLSDVRQAQMQYDAAHGPGRWAFPYAS